MLTTFRFGTNEKHIREALTAAFKRRGVDLAEFDASIRSIMVAAAFSTGVEEQVEAFIRLARVAERFDLPDELRREPRNAERSCRLSRQDAIRQSCVVVSQGSQGSGGTQD